MFRENLQRIVRRVDLDEKSMSEMISAIFSGDITDAQIGAFMAALATKGETFEELAGAARAMRRKAHRIQTSAATVVDTCGTGGDGLRTFNISTTAAFVVAGCGVTVAKHGNRSITSQCGSADMLEALGVRIDVEPEVVEEAVESIGIGFLFAPRFHGAMRFAARARKEVALRSIFNMLGPLTNPAGANCQLIGVYAPELTEMFAETLRLLGSRRALVVHGHDGLDEISVCAPTRVAELADGQVRTYNIDPADYFGTLADPADMRGGEPAANAAITRQVLQGQTGARRHVVLINAAAALMAAGQAQDLKEGLVLAAAAIDDGRALAKMEQLVEFTRAAGRSAEA